MNVIPIPIGSPLFEAYSKNPGQFDRAINLAAEYAARVLGHEAASLFSVKDKQKQDMLKAA